MAIIVFEHSELVDVGRLGAALRDYGHKLRIIRPADGEQLPPDLNNVDGVISCGGPQSANDSDAWIGEELKYLRDACDSELPVIGICLGHQLLAKAMGGEVARMSSGIELGWHNITLSHFGREDILHTGLPWDMTVFNWHHDQVTELPAGAKLLASSDKCKVQAWTMGLRIYGFQYQPAITPSTIDSWIENEPDALTEAGISADELRDAVGQQYPTYERLTKRLFESIALYLIPVDRKNPGVVKDLHH